MERGIDTVHGWRAGQWYQIGQLAVTRSQHAAYELLMFLVLSSNK